tara:strand:+ start:9534 stop:10025 length:492 start_codon:yes stop_codon:yes gene_type:complete
MNLLAIDFKQGFVGGCTTVTELEQRRALITAWGNKIEQLDDASKIEFQVTHRFADNVYIREMLIPQDSFIIGKIHTTQFFNILVSGQCLLATTDGVIHIRAPYTFISEPGSQKCAIALTDVLWQTVHVTDEKDPAKIADSLTVDSYEELTTDFAMDQLLGEHI